jgi:hypothetical protein
MISQSACERVGILYKGTAGLIWFGSLFVRMVEGPLLGSPPPTLHCLLQHSKQPVTILSPEWRDPENIFFYKDVLECRHLLVSSCVVLELGVRMYSKSLPQPARLWVPNVYWGLGWAEKRLPELTPLGHVLVPSKQKWGWCFATTRTDPRN